MRISMREVGIVLLTNTYFLLPMFQRLQVHDWITPGAHLIENYPYIFDPILCSQFEPRDPILNIYGKHASVLLLFL